MAHRRRRSSRRQRGSAPTVSAWLFACFGLRCVAPLGSKIHSFRDGEALIRSGEVDAVIIATPPFQHTTLGIAALTAGVHAMVEKPISSHKADAERLIAAHTRSPNTVFAGMFQLRVEPRYLRI